MKVTICNVCENIISPFLFELRLDTAFAER